MKKEIKFMSTVAKDIIQLKFKPTMTLQQAETRFYGIMRKYGIKEGTKSGNSRTVSNFEWTMCQILFLQRLHDYFVIDRFLFVNNTPKDLEQY